MKLKTKYLLIITTILLLSAISGCKEGGFFRGNTDTMQTYKFRSGAEGLRMEFLEGMPPKNVFVGTEFTTGVKVKNMGAYDVSGNAELKITVPDPSAFDFKEGNTRTLALTGRSLYIKEGQEDVIMFPMRALCFPGYDGTRASIVQNYTRKIQATACYYYETIANADLCIDTMKFKRQKGDKVECNMEDVSLSGGQGGPVGVTKIAPTVIPKDTKTTTVQLGVTIDKLKGLDHSIFHPSNGCDIKRQNNVTVDVELGGKKLKCNPSEVQLKEKSTVGTICQVPVDATLGAYKTPVSVTIKYYVRQMMLKDIKVEPPPGGVNCNALKSGTS